MFNILQFRLMILVLLMPAVWLVTIKIEPEMRKNVKKLLAVFEFSPKDGAISIMEIEEIIANSTDMDGKIRNVLVDFSEYISPGFSQLMANHSIINNEEQIEEYGNLLKRFVKDADADNNGKADFKEMAIFVYHVIEALEDSDLNGDGITDFEEAKHHLCKKIPDDKRCNDGIKDGEKMKQHIDAMMKEICEKNPDVEICNTANVNKKWEL